MIFEILVSCFFIGVLVSAPMGPTGILCIRRTLHKGRREGMLSGVGAVLSDIIYASISYLGVGYVVSFLEDNNTIFTILGSLLVMGFAFYLFYGTTSYHVKDRDDGRNDLRTVVSAFGLTLGNPSIILFFVALFARFTVVPVDGQQLLGYFVAMVGIAMGAMSWWTFITYLVSKLRDRFTVSGVSWFNRIIAIIFLIVAIAGLISGLTALL